METKVNSTTISLVRGDITLEETDAIVNAALALEKKLRSLAFPSISTGAYGYPVEEASLIAVSAVIGFIRENDGLDLVRFVLFSDRDLEVYSRALKGAL